MKVLTTTLLRWWLFLGLLYFGGRALADDRDLAPNSSYSISVHDKFEMEVATGRIEGIDSGFKKFCTEPAPSPVKDAAPIPAPCTQLHQVYKTAILDSLDFTKPRSTVKLLELGFKIDEKDFMNHTPLENAVNGVHGQKEYNLSCRPDIALELRALNAESVYGEKKMNVARNLTMENQNELKRLRPLPIWDYDKSGKLKPGHEKELVDAKQMRVDQIQSCKTTQWILTPAENGGIDMNKVKQAIQGRNFKGLHEYLKEHGFSDEKIDDMAFDPEDRNKTSALHHAIQSLKVYNDYHAGIFSEPGAAPGAAAVSSSQQSR
jgi:hypothetical protein